MTVLILDNYDSFTWNLVHGLEAAGAQCVVRRSDAVTLHEIRELKPDRIVLSPGPFDPYRTGVCLEAVRELKGQIPMLGVCLGMQVIAVAAGATVAPSGHPIHGKAFPVWHDNGSLLHGLPNPFDGARYHSLVVLPSSLPSGLTVSAWSQDRTVLGCRWGQWKIEGVMFHPESFLTPHGQRIFQNFLLP